MGNTPVQYEAARAALAKCVKTDECKGWVDRAAAMKVYARQAKDREMEMNAVEIRVRAERRLGELIQLQKQTVGLAKGRAGPGRGKAGAKAGPAFNDAPTLADAGIDKKLSSRCQGLASIPECEFEKGLIEARERFNLGTYVSAGLVRQAAMRRNAIERNPEPEEEEEEERDEALDKATEQSMWRRGLVYRAFEATRNARFKDWSNYEVDDEVVKAAKIAARAWLNVAEYLDDLRNGPTTTPLERIREIEEGEAYIEKIMIDEIMEAEDKAA